MKPVVGHRVTKQVAFVGPVGVGKTTAVRTISDTVTVNTDVVCSPQSLGGRHRAGGKRSTTVGIDYGEWRRGDGDTVAVYGTPGQARFAEARTSAMTGRSHLILWLYGQNEHAVEECDEWLRFLGEHAWPRLTLAVTRSDDSPVAPPLEAYRTLAAKYHAHMHVVKADARERGDVENVIRAALRETPVLVGGKEA